MSLDLVPISDLVPNHIESPIFVTVPDSNGNAPGGPQNVQRARQEWFQSLRKCYLNTLRSISFASQSRNPLSSDQEHVTSASSALDVLASDLRFPKSPSQQLEREAQRENAKLSPIDGAEEEREERVFWSERFKLVFEDVKQTYGGILIPTSVGSHDTKAPQPNKTCRFRSSETFI
jgi:hypothetical protein